MVFVFSASAYAISVDKKIIDTLDNNTDVSVIVMMKKEPIKVKTAIVLTANELKNKRDFSALNGYSGKTLFCKKYANDLKKMGIYLSDIRKP